MAWNDLKTAVAAVIRTNGTQEITGALLQSTLNSIIDQVGVDATFKGIATPTTNPGTPDGRTFYIAATHGSYPNFGTFTINNGEIALFSYNGVWSCEKILDLSGSLIGNTIMNRYIRESDGAISSSDETYRLTKFRVEVAGNYYIRCNSNSYPILWKYSDNTYSTPVSQVIGAGPAVDGVYLLQPGYYALCWVYNANLKTIVYDKSVIDGVMKSVTDSITSINQSITTINSQMTGFNNATTKPIIKSLFGTNDLIISKYIHDGDGIISDADGTYRLAKFQITEYGQYWLFSKYGNIHPFMWKYSDNTYSTPTTQIIASSNANHNATYQLEPGFYALCWSNSTTPLIIVDNEAFVTKVDSLLQFISDNVTTVDKNRISFADIDITKLTLAGSASRVNGQILTSGGANNKAYLAGGMEAAHWTISARYSCSGGNSFIIGKDGAQYGAYIELYNEGGVGKYKLINNPGISTDPVAVGEVGFAFVENREYLAKIELNVQTLKVLTLKIYGKYNEYFSHEFTGITVNGYGNPFFASNSNCTIRKVSISIQNYYDIKNAKLAVWGHSFVEGDSLGADRMSSFTNLLAAELGVKQVLNLGLGGDTIPGIYSKMQNEVDLVANIQYGLLCIGVNDGSSSATMISQLQSIITLLESNNIIPVLFTIEPKTTGFNAQHQAVNVWIRQSGYNYVDMEAVFVDPTGAIIDSLFLGDGVHPNVQGHALILQRIKMDCPFLF